MASWQSWIDRSGIFTDIVARDPQGRLAAHKLLSDMARLVSRWTGGQVVARGFSRRSYPLRLPRTITLRPPE